MCGIVGQVGRADSGQLERALHAMRHRGPDARGILRERVGEFHVGLGHARLSILDLSSAANQPFESADGRHVIVYNGELYNHAELRAELASRGHAFRTHSDTEVLLTALIALGERALPRLDGMFAFAWLDRDAQRLTLARDRLGIKPLYVRRHADASVSFASEIAALAAVCGIPNEPDPACFGEFLLNGFLYEPASGIAGVEKVPPGHAWTIDLRRGACRDARYVDAEAAHDVTQAGRLGLGELLSTSVRDQAIADVNLGLFFSGGIDSSAIAAATTSPLKGLFVSYANDRRAGAGDDAYVADVAQALHLSVIQAELEASLADPEALLREFGDVAAGTEEPISDYTFASTRLISRVARDRGFKVMLSGMGGDELFGGYPRYLMAMRHRLLARWPWVTRAAPRLLRGTALENKATRTMNFAHEPDFGLAYASLVGYFSAHEVATLLGTSTGVERFRERVDTFLQPVRHASPLRQALHLDRIGFLAHNLTVTDKASMRESVEVRVPFLSNAMLAYSERLSDDAMIRGRQTKRPLKQYLEQRLPHRLVHRTKTGFNPPLDGRIRALGRHLLRTQILCGPCERALDPREVDRLVDEHFDRRANHTYKLWQLLYFSLWLRSLEGAARARDATPQPVSTIQAAA